MKYGALFLGLTLTFPASAGSAGDVLACMQANAPASLRLQELEFETTDKLGTSSVLRGRLYAERVPSAAGKKRIHAMLKLSSPQNMAGAAYLIREKEGELADGMYVYLPAVKRVRRVTGSFADGGLMGTSFSYADFKLLQNSFEGAKVSFEGDSEIEQRPVHRLVVTPAQSDENNYGPVRLWVDQQSCVPLKAEFERDGVVRKRLYTPVRALQRSGAHWYPATVEMRDEKEGRRTVLRIRGLGPAENLSGGYFDPKTFYLR